MLILKDGGNNIKELFKKESMFTINKNRKSG